MTNSGLKLIFKLSTLCGLSICLWIFASGALTQSSKLTVENRQDSPLQISSFQIDLTYSETSSDVTLMLTSSSLKPVRAFTIASSVGQEKTSAVLITTDTDEQMWHFNEIKPIKIRKSHDEIQNGVKLSIDFIEFSDGSTWGPDSFNSADDLAGEDVGLRSSVQSLSEISKTKGLNALTNNVDIPTPPGKSLSWQRGFQRGTRTVSERLNRAYKKGGQEQLQAEWERLLADSKRISPK